MKYYNKILCNCCHKVLDKFLVRTSNKPRDIKENKKTYSFQSKRRIKPIIM